MNKLTWRLAASVLVLILSFAGLAAQAIPAGNPEALGLSSDRLQRLDAGMKAYIDQGRVAGMVTLVLRDGKVAHSGVYGFLDLEKRTPMVPDAIFRIASQSKAVTSVAVMILQEEGKLLITDPVSKYIPEFKHSRVATTTPDGRYQEVPAKREITLRDLLTHTAGISYGSGPAEKAYRWEQVFGWYFADHDEPVGNAIKRLAGLPFSAQPGERFLYGFNTDILGYVVEVASGMPLDKFFEEKIFKPLKMNDTHFFLPVDKLSRFTPVYGHDLQGKLYLVEKPEESKYFKGPRKCFSGGAGLLSTALDYSRLLEMLRQGGKLEGNRVLSRKSVELMISNNVGDLYSDGKQGFGLGFWINEKLGSTGELGSVGAFGWGGAYYTTYWVDPVEKMVCVLMTQLLPARDIDLQQKFQALVYQAIAD